LIHQKDRFSFLGTGTGSGSLAPALISI